MGGEEKSYEIDTSSFLGRIFSNWELRFTFYWVK